MRFKNCTLNRSKEEAFGEEIKGWQEEEWCDWTNSLLRMKDIGWWEMWIGPDYR